MVLRITTRNFVFMKQERKPRTYKIQDKYYAKAIKRAKKEKTHLSVVVEMLVMSYGADARIDVYIPAKAELKIK